MAERVPVTTDEYVQQRPVTAQPAGDGNGIPAIRTVFDGLADQAARVPWCWPALLTVVLGLYQVGRPAGALARRAG